MTFQAIVGHNSQMTSLDTTLNKTLEDYPGSTVVGLGLSWGNEENRAGILLDYPGKDSGSSVQSKSFSESGNLEDLEQQVQNWLNSFTGTVLALALDKSNDKWKTLILYNDDDPQVTYAADFEQESKASDEQSGINTELAKAKSVAAFGFTYGNSTYGALFISST